jgi:hypothetical protein
MTGGYIGVFSVTDGTGWQQQTAEQTPINLRHHAQVGSRRERRALCRALSGSPACPCARSRPKPNNIGSTCRPSNCVCRPPENRLLSHPSSNPRAKRGFFAP